MLRRSALRWTSAADSPERAFASCALCAATIPNPIRASMLTPAEDLELARFWQRLFSTSETSLGSWKSSTAPFAFDDGDLAVVERLAQTVVLTLSKAEV